MVNPDSDLYRAHQNWVYHFANRARTEKRNQLVLNLARQDVADWTYQTLDRLLSEHNISFIKWDMNRHFAQPGWPAETGRNPERIWTEHIRSLYRILDGLRAAHPGVAFESCSGGGVRVDLGILSRVEPVWTSDNTDAWDRMRIQEGFSQAYSPQVMMAWVTDSPIRPERPLHQRRHRHRAPRQHPGLRRYRVAWRGEIRIRKRPDPLEARRLAVLVSPTLPVS